MFFFFVRKILEKFLQQVFGVEHCPGAFFFGFTNLPLAAINFYLFDKFAALDFFLRCNFGRVVVGLDFACFSWPPGYEKDSQVLCEVRSGNHTAIPVFLT